MSPPRFAPGDKAYGRDGRAYTVEVMDGATVYCTADNGVETEFPAGELMTEAEFAGRADGRRDAAFTRLKQSRAYTTAGGKLDRATAEKLLAKVQRLSPSLLDFVAFTTAERILTENKDAGLAADLSIVKCRALFDSAKPEARAAMLASVLGTGADLLASAVNLGDNLMLAMIEKGLSGQRDAFEAFRDRPRR